MLLSLCFQEFTLNSNDYSLTAVFYLSVVVNSSHIRTLNNAQTGQFSRLYRTDRWNQFQSIARTKYTSIKQIRDSHRYAIHVHKLLVRFIQTWHGVQFCSPGYAVRTIGLPCRCSSSTPATSTLPFISTRFCIMPFAALVCDFSENTPLRPADHRKIRRSSSKANPPTMTSAVDAFCRHLVVILWYGHRSTGRYLCMEEAESKLKY